MDWSVYPWKSKSIVLIDFCCRLAILMIQPSRLRTKVGACVPLPEASSRQVSSDCKASGAASRVVPVTLCSEGWPETHLVVNFSIVNLDTGNYEGRYHSCHNWCTGIMSLMGVDIWIGARGRPFYSKFGRIENNNTLAQFFASLFWLNVLCLAGFYLFLCNSYLVGPYNSYYPSPFPIIFCFQGDTPGDYREVGVDLPSEALIDPQIGGLNW